MPIKIPNGLPAFKTLAEDRIMVIDDERATHQDIRPLEIAILNLMPKKVETETQLLRLLSNTPLQINIELLQMASHDSKTTPQEHMFKFYTTFDKIKDRYFDGLIITGAPVEQLEFEDVDYWSEMCEIMEWSKSHVYSVLHICWGAQAGLFYHYGIKKYQLEKKMFGVFEHRVLNPRHPILNGFDDIFLVPHSRHTEVRRSDIEKVSELEILAESDKAGVDIVGDKSMRSFFIFGHREYDKRTLADEYFRDLEKELPIDIPYNYFPDDNPNNKPLHTWICHANLMFSNWLNFIVYPGTPFEITEIK